LTRVKVPVSVIKPLLEAAVTAGVAVVFVDSSIKAIVTLAGNARGIITIACGEADT
jgi:ABC-type sugar transport system substrate-binding protein